MSGTELARGRRLKDRAHRVIWDDKDKSIRHDRYEWERWMWENIEDLLSMAEEK